jgi:hypothetical protein
MTAPRLQPSDPIVVVIVIPAPAPADRAEAAPRRADAAGGLPIDDSMRRAVFAALRDHYGFDLDRDARLATLSRILGRRVTTIKTLTRAEAGRVLDALSGRAASPASRQLRTARTFIRQAATEGRISAAERDRYLAKLDAVHGSAASDDAALTEVRDRAIDFYRDGAICHPGLSDFLAAAGLARYNP